MCGDRFSVVENLLHGLRRVEANEGAPGLDGMTLEAPRPYVKAHWLEVKAALDSGRYRPSPVKRVEIPKADGGVRQHLRSTWRTAGCGPACLVVWEGGGATRLVTRLRVSS